MKFLEHKLENGLEIIAEANDRAYSSSLAFFVRTGARDETPQIAGVSHFLEHMVFKGTDRRSAADVNRELDELGSHSNAYTSEEQTVYYATVLPEYQRPVTDLLADIMRPALRDDDFETEKKVIIEEILKYEDQPPFNAHEKCMAAFFSDHPLAQSVLGTSETVGALTPTTMRTYFEQRYSPGNLTLVATGKIDFDLLVQDARSFCGDWSPQPAPRDLPPAVGQTGEQRFTKSSATQSYVIQISSAPEATDQGRFAARVLSYILGDDSGSRLYWALVDTGLAEYAGASCYEFDNAGILMSYLCGAPEDTDRNLTALKEIQATIQEQGVTEDEIELAKSKICSQLVRRSERPGNRLFAVGNNWLQRRSYSSVKEAVAAYQRVTQADIRAFLELHPIQKTMTVTIGPDN